MISQGLAHGSAHPDYATDIRIKKYKIADLP